MGKKHRDASPLRTKKPTLEVVEVVPRLDYGTDIEAERLLVRQINAHLAVLNDQYKFLSGPFPYKIEFKIQGALAGPYIVFTNHCFKIPSLVNPKLVLLSLDEKSYSWTEVSILLSQLTRTVREATLEEIRLQVENWIVSTGHLHTACFELRIQLDADYTDQWQISGDEIAVKNQHPYLKPGTCLWWRLGKYQNASVLPPKNYTKFAEMLVLFLQLLK